MSARATDLMPIAIALVMGSIATEFILPTDPPKEVMLGFQDFDDLNLGEIRDSADQPGEALQSEDRPLAKRPE